MNRKITILIVFLPVITCFATNEPNKAFLTLEQIYSQWNQNYSSFESLEVEFIERIVKTEPNDAPFVRYTHIHRITEGDKFYHKDLPAPDSNYYSVASFDGAEFRQFSRDDDGQINGFIKDNPTERQTYDYDWINIYLQLYPDKTEQPPLIHLLGKPELWKITVQPTLENVHGLLCHVVIAGNDKTFYKVWFAHNKGMLPVKSIEKFSGELRLQVEVLELGYSNNLWYPKKATCIRLEGPYLVTKELDVIKFMPNSPVAEGMFKIEFPMGTEVYDKRIEESYTVGVKD